MSVIDQAAGTITREEIVQRARDLQPLLKKNARDTELQRSVPEENVQAILDAELHLVAVPLRYGGFDVDLATLYDVSYELGRACGSTAWCYSVWAAHNWWSGFWAPEVQDELYADGPKALVCSSSFAAEVEVQDVDGGYIVTGMWRFSSGSDHAAWATFVAPHGNKRLRILVPRSDFEVQSDSWHVAGLQGTGSKDVRINGAFVPKYRTEEVSFDVTAEPEGTAWDPVAYHDRQRRYTVSIPALIGWDLVAPAIGMAQAAVDELAARLQGTAGTARSADSAIIQEAVSLASAEVNAAYTLLRADIEETQVKGEAGVMPTKLDLARWTRDKAFATNLTVQSASRIFELTGGRGIFLSDPIQRYFRDVQAASHRDTLSFKFAGRPYGALLLGAE